MDVEVTFLPGESVPEYSGWFLVSFMHGTSVPKYSRLLPDPFWIWKLLENFIALW
jgi:hypothetical protein